MEHTMGTPVVTDKPKLRIRVSPADARRYATEAIGACLLSLVVLLLSSQQGLSLLTPMLAALTIGIFVYVAGSISGAHINPALTLGALSINKISLKHAIGYIISQLIGGAIALVLAAFLLGKGISFVQHMDGLTTHIFLAEMVGMIVFGFGVAAVLYGKVNQAATGIVIGSSLLIGTFIAALSGSAGILNPAIAFSAGSLNIVYGLAPIVGSLIGMNLYKVLKSE